MRQEAAAPSPTRWLVLIVVLVGQFLIVGSVGTMNIALPAIRSDLDASPAAIQWVLVLYQLGYASLLVTGGRLGDLLGRKGVFVVGLAGFVASSALAAIAPSAGWLIGARLLQGLFGGITSPQVVAVIQVAFSAQERPRAFAAFGMVSGSAFMIGQILSGVLIGADLFGLGWRAVLLPNVVLGALAVPAAIRLLPPTGRNPEHRLDLTGMVLGMVTAVLVLFPLIQGRNAGWPPVMFLMLATAAPMLFALLRFERHLTDRGGQPLVDLGLFQGRSFRGGLLVAVAFSFSTLPTFYVLTLTLQLGFRFDALKAALATAPTPVAVIVMSIVSARLVNRLGRKVLALAGLVSMSAALTLMLTVTLAPRPLNPLYLVPALLLQGCGNGIGMTGVMNLTLVDVPHASAGSASGLLQTIQQGSAAIGVAVAGLVFFGVVGSETTLDAYAAGMRATLGLTIVCGAAMVFLHRLLPPHAVHRHGDEPALVPADPSVP